MNLKIDVVNFLSKFFVDSIIMSKFASHYEFTSYQRIYSKALINKNKEIR